MTQKIDVTPLSGACGAVITGVDLSEPLGNETFAAIHQALLDHQLSSSAIRTSRPISKSRSAGASVICA